MSARAPLIVLFGRGNLIRHGDQWLKCLNGTIRRGERAGRKIGPNASIKFSSSVRACKGSGISSEASVEEEFREPLEEEEAPSGEEWECTVLMCRRSVRRRG
jgi:hypothetical protein